jgi:hypothetical protein
MDGYSETLIYSNMIKLINLYSEHKDIITVIKKVKI